MKILVTGAGGLIGSALVARLSGRHDIYALSRTARSGPPVHGIVADLAAPELLPDLPSVDAVVHLAQSPHYAEFPNRARDIFDVNLASTVRLLDWSRGAGVRHFILASTGGVDSPTRSFYAVTKHSAEQFARCYSDAFAVLALRFHFVYGPGQRPSMLVPRIIDNVRHGRPVPLTGCDGPTLNPTYVGDAVAAIEAALEQQVQGTIPIAGPERLSIRRMAEIIAARLGTSPTFTIDDTASSQDLLGDVSEMSRRLVAPKWTFAAGVAQMLS